MTKSTKILSHNPAKNYRNLKSCSEVTAWTKVRDRWQHTWWCNIRYKNIKSPRYPGWINNYSSWYQFKLKSLFKIIFHTENVPNPHHHYSSAILISPGLFQHQTACHHAGKQCHAAPYHDDLTHWPLGDFKEILDKWFSSYIYVIDGWGISNEVAIRWMSLDFSKNKSTLVQVMAWCHQATSHNLNQCWPRSLSPYGVIRRQWVKALRHVNKHKIFKCIVFE